MANVEEKKEQGTQVNDQGTRPEPTPMMPTNGPEEKRGFFRDLGLGAKIGIGLVFGGLIAGGVYLVKTLLGKDEEEPAALPERNEPNE